MSRRLATSFLALLATTFAAGALLLAAGTADAANATPPAAPAPVAGRVTTTGVQLTWTAPATNGAPITRYELRRGTTLVSAYLAATSTSFTNSGLQPGTTYTYTMRACASVGCSPDSTPVTATTPPLAPTNIAATPGSGSITVSWTPSTSASNGHAVLYRTSTSVPWTEWTPSTSDTSPTTVTGLANGTVYTIAVAARAADASTLTPLASATPRDVPVSPAPFQSAATSSSVRVSWIAPASNGAPVREYRFIWDGQQLATLPATSLQYTVTGLGTGKTFTAAVVACNAAGCSQPSPSLPLGTLPVAPSNLAATPGATSMSLTWTASPSPYVTGYVVEYRPATASTWVEWTPGTADAAPTTVTGLVNGVSYAFRVTAANVGGRSTSIGVSATPRTSPDAPSLSVLSSTQTSVTLTWPVPAANGSPVSSYKVYRDASLVASVTTTRATIGSLFPASQSVVAVSACNVAGCSTPAPLTVTTPPAAPTVSATRASGAVTLTWAPVSGTVDRYTVEYRLTSSSTWTEWTPGTSDTAPTTVSGLVNGLGYAFRVAAVNAGGATPSAIAYITPVGAPTLPTPAPTASGVHTTGLTVSWTLPATTGGFSVSSFQIYRNGALAATTGATARSHTLYGLEPGTNHGLQIRFCTSAGCSPFSEATTIPTTPAAPIDLKLTEGNGTLDISWTDSDSAVVVGHRVYISEGTDESVEWTPGVDDTSPTTITGLVNGMSYYVVVVAYNASGATAADKVKGSPYTFGAAPSGLTATAAASDDAVLTWSPPADDGGAAVIGFVVQYTTGTTWYDLPAETVSIEAQQLWVLPTPVEHAVLEASADHLDTSGEAPLFRYTVSGLMNGTSYRFRVASYNRAGVSAFTASSASVLHQDALTAATDLVWNAIVEHDSKPYNETVGFGVRPSGCIYDYGMWGPQWQPKSDVSVCTDPQYTVYPNPALLLVVDGPDQDSMGAVGWPTSYIAPWGDDTAIEIDTEGMDLYVFEDALRHAVAERAIAEGVAQIYFNNGNMYFLGSDGAWWNSGATHRAVGLIGYGTMYDTYRPGAPGAPTAVTAQAGAASASVAWTAPTSTGRVPNGIETTLSQYEVSASPGGATCSVAHPATTCVVEGLTPGTEYAFTVRARNTAWIFSDPSAASDPVAPTAPPGPSVASIETTLLAVNEAPNGPIYNIRIGLTRGLGSIDWRDSDGLECAGTASPETISAYVWFHDVDTDRYFAGYAYGTGSPTVGTAALYNYSTIDGLRITLSAAGTRQATAPDADLATVMRTWAFTDEPLTPTRFAVVGLQLRYGTMDVSDPANPVYRMCSDYRIFDPSTVVDTLPQWQEPDLSVNDGTWALTASRKPGWGGTDQERSGFSVSYTHPACEGGDATGICAPSTPKQFTYTSNWACSQAMEFTIFDAAEASPGANFPLTTESGRLERDGDVFYNGIVDSSEGRQVVGTRTENPDGSCVYTVDLYWTFRFARNLDGTAVPYSDSRLEDLTFLFHQGSSSPQGVRLQRLGE